MDGASVPSALHVNCAISTPHGPSMAWVHRRNVVTGKRTCTAAPWRGAWSALPSASGATSDTSIEKEHCMRSAAMAQGSNMSSRCTVGLEQVLHGERVCCGQVRRVAEGKHAGAGQWVVRCQTVYLSATGIAAHLHSE